MADKQGSKALTGEQSKDPETLARELEGELILSHSDAGEGDIDDDVGEYDNIVGKQIFTSPEVNGREVRYINKKLNLAEYSQAWTKIDLFVFFEILNIIRDLYTAKSDEFIHSITQDNITIKLPISQMSTRLLNPKNRSSQLRDSSERLMDMKVRTFTEDNDGQMGFDFITMFPRITYDPSVDSKHIYIRVQSEVYEEMIPMTDYAQLDLLLMEELDKGNTIRIYSVLKQYAHKGKFKLTFDQLRREMGCYQNGTWKEWRAFNNKVLKVAVSEINERKEYDIEVYYKKAHGADEIEFEVIQHAHQRKGYVPVSSLDEIIDKESRLPNMIQQKYIQTTISHCLKVVEVSNVNELTQWIISDLINQQEKQADKFSFKKAMNYISHQIRRGSYTEPYSHKYLAAAVAKTADENVVDKDPIKNTQSLDDKTREEIKKMEYKGDLQEIRDRFSNETLIANQFGYLLDEFELMGINKDS